MKLRCYILSLLVLLLSACTTETGRQLSLADAVMEQYPDSAMSILSRIDRQSLKASDFPYYALLYTQAQVKTDIPLDSDSLISIAYAKYGSYTRGDRGIRSNFYTGEVFFNQENYREAMKYYLTAYEESKRLHNNYWHAKAAERISDLFFFAYNYDEATKYSQEAADLFLQLGKLRNHRYTLVQLAGVMLNNGEEDKAYTLLDSLQKIVKISFPVDSALLGYIRLPMIDAMMKTGKTIDIDMDVIESLKKDTAALDVIDMAIFESQIQNAINNTEMAKDVLETVKDLAHSDEDQIHLLYARYENARRIGDNSLAFSIVDSMLFYENALAEEILQESVTGAQRDFYSALAVNNDKKYKMFKWLLVIAVVVLLSIILLIILIFFFRNKAQKLEMQANLEAFLSLRLYSDRISRERDALEKTVSDNDIIIRDLSEKIHMGDQKDESLTKVVDERDERLRSHLPEKEDVGIDYSSVIEKLFREKWSAIDILCDQYFALNNSEVTPKGLALNIEKEIKKVVSKKGLAQIVEATDEYMGNIVSRLRTQCKFIKEADVSFLALLYAGFSVRAVCMFTGIKYDYFYVKKSRLIKRIEASEAPDKSLFLQKLK